MRGDDVEFRWESIKSPYVPGYTLRRYVNRKRKSQLIEGWKGELNVLQDINRERWLYGIDMVDARLKGDPRPTKIKASGHAPSLEEARAEAEKLMSLASPHARKLRELEQEDADAFG